MRDEDSKPDLMCDRFGAIVLLPNALFPGYPAMVIAMNLVGEGVAFALQPCDRQHPISPIRPCADCRAAADELMGYGLARLGIEPDPIWYRDDDAVPLR